MHTKNGDFALIVGYCLALFLFAFALRGLGADYGYFHGDERINDAAKVLTGELIPGQHFYPPLINYVNATAFGGLFAAGLGLGWWDSPGAFRDQYFVDPTIFYVTARLLTAVFGAFLAPLFFLAARMTGLSVRSALVAGLFGVLFPLGVFLSHIAKGDVAMATFVVAAFAVALKRLETSRPARWDVWFGVSVVLALSFKHSALFILAPLALGHLAIVAWRENIRASGAAFVRGIVAVLVLWPILNIGTLLDLSTFLEYQKIQSVMSVRGIDNPADGILTLAMRAPMLVLGVNPVTTIATLLLPVLLLLPACKLRHKALVLVFWVSLLIGTLFVAFLAGTRQPEHLWITNFAGFVLLASLTLLGLFEGTESRLRFVAGTAISLSLALTALGAARPLGEALAQPTWQKTDALLRTEFADRRVLTMVETDIPMAREAQQMQFARWDRLAAKYNVTMPEIAEERIIKVSAPDAQFVYPMPGVMYGLEHLDDDAEDLEVQPHAWPLQTEEWQLDYWLSRDFRTMFVKNLDYQLNEVDAPLVRAFFADVVARCELTHEILPNKPLFLERKVSVFEC